MNKNPDLLPLLVSALLGALLGFTVACALKDRAYRPQLDQLRSLLHSHDTTYSMPKK